MSGAKLKLPNNANVEVLAISLSNYTAALPEVPPSHPTGKPDGDERRYRRFWRDRRGQPTPLLSMGN